VSFAEFLDAIGVSPVTSLIISIILIFIVPLALVFVIVGVLSRCPSCGVRFRNLRRKKIDEKILSETETGSIFRTKTTLTEVTYRCNHCGHVWSVTHTSDFKLGDFDRW